MDLVISITPEAMREMAEKLEHKGPGSVNWHEVMYYAAAMLRSIAAERECEWWRLPQVKAKTTNNTGAA